MTQFLRDQASDSEEVVTPLMLDGTYLSRNFATLGPMLWNLKIETEDWKRRWKRKSFGCRLLNRFPEDLHQTTGFMITASIIDTAD